MNEKVIYIDFQGNIWVLWGKDPKLYVDGLNINRSKSSNLSLLFTKNV